MTTMTTTTCTQHPAVAASATKARMMKRRIHSIIIIIIIIFMVTVNRSRYVTFLTPLCGSSTNNCLFLDLRTQVIYTCSSVFNRDVSPEVMLMVAPIVEPNRHLYLDSSKCWKSWTNTESVVLLVVVPYKLLLPIPLTCTLCISRIVPVTLIFHWPTLMPTWIRSMSTFRRRPLPFDCYGSTKLFHQRLPRAIAPMKTCRRKWARRIAPRLTTLPCSMSFYAPCRTPCCAVIPIIPTTIRSMYQRTISILIPP
jgi:hypothetical protein